MRTMSRGFRNRYPTYNVLDKWDSPSWNDRTRAVVEKRLHEVPERRFFSDEEWSLAQAICECPASGSVREERPVEEGRVDGPSLPVKERGWASTLSRRKHRRNRSSKSSAAP